MQMIIHEKGAEKAAEILDENIIINKVQDALNIMADAGYHDARNIILHERNLNPEFFNLRSGLAGDILQKFVNYRVKIAIVGDFSKYESKNLKDFIYECNKGKLIFFIPDIEKAKEKLFKQ
jgi:hypothetical protein